jgi:photosystem II stability/assembly factor-like uncharacterized protein
MKKISNCVCSILLLLIVHFTFNIVNCEAQWFYQPIGASGTPCDMKFFDANTGIISYTNTLPPTSYRTTNSGQNWILMGNYYMNGFNKLDSNTMYAIGSMGIHRTFNKGLTWDSVSFFTGFGPTGLSFINKDTGWATTADGFAKWILKTTDGGITFNTLATGIGGGQIYFLKYKINGEYYGWCTDYSAVYKTTNSGQNWTFLGGPPYDIEQLTMYNENIGWICASDTNAYKTTNGGLSWIAKPMPRPPNLFMNFINRIIIINSNLLYGIGGSRYFGPGIGDGIIWKSTNGGNNWGYQQPDTAYPITKYLAIDFIDSNTGWAYGYASQGGVHTTNGGGQILKITNTSEQITNQYKLYQNYPNPFNPATSIKYKVESKKHIKLIVFNILGKEIATLVNEKQKTGEYEVSFNALTLATGIYYYALYADGVRIDARKMVVIK